MKKFVALVTGYSSGDSYVIFAEAENEETVLKDVIESHGGFDLTDADEFEDAERLLEECPIGIGEIIEGEKYPSLTFYYDLSNVDF